uniref:Uncharacterized protein n=1 Tax=Rhizophora mucronata TaxID=61149 RepID=A0A2P2L2X1_RHIMU
MCKLNLQHYKLSNKYMRRKIMSNDNKTLQLNLCRTQKYTYHCICALYFLISLIIVIFCHFCNSLY